MNLFHIHTYRCKHASDENDESCILKAIEMGADSITFTDHAPFPKNPFKNRMDFEELDEYCATLKSLREKYAEKIKVGIALEIEYLPKFNAYYKELFESGKLDFLLLGQHFFELGDGSYSFSLPAERKNAEEHIGLINAMIEGIETGFFKYVAHPDRAFHRIKKWTDEADALSQKLIAAAVKAKIPLEKNISSIKKPHNFWKEFWELVPKDHQTFYGLDAHSVKELEIGFSLKNSHSMRNLCATL